MRASAVVLAAVLISCGAAVPSDVSNAPTPPATTAPGRPGVSTGDPGLASSLFTTFLAETEGHVEASSGEADCRGHAVFRVDPARRPPLGLLASALEISFRACPAGTVVTEAHIHPLSGREISLAPTAPKDHAEQIRLLWTIGPTALAHDGTGTLRAVAHGLDPRAFDELVADPGAFGFYVHTQRNPNGGAGRGRVRRE